MSDESPAVRELIVPGRLWFVGPQPIDPDPREACRLILRTGAGVGGRAAATPAFTDRDLAVRFIAGLGEGGAGLQPVSWPNPTDLALALAYLAQIGGTHIVFDPEPGSDQGRVFTISQVIDGLVGRPG